MNPNLFDVLREQLSRMAKIDYCSAFWTFVIPSPQFRNMPLKDRCLHIFVALCTYPMRWFGRIGRFLQRTNIDTWMWGVKPIALFLSIPCFFISESFFKLAYAI